MPPVHHSRICCSPLLSSRPLQRAAAQHVGQLLTQWLLTTHTLRCTCTPGTGGFHSSRAAAADNPADGAPGRTAERAGAAGERVADRLSGVHDSVAGRGFNIPEEGAGGYCHRMALQSTSSV
jgi:hypothetical protein